MTARQDRLNAFVLPAENKLAFSEDTIVITCSLSLLKRAAEQAPFFHHVDPEKVEPGTGFQITDVKEFARALCTELLEEQGEAGSLMAEAFDDAAERIVDNAGPGWAWPAIGQFIKP